LSLSALGSQPPNHQATKESLVQLAIKFDSSGALDFILEMPARDSFDSPAFLAQISPEKLVLCAIRHNATEVLSLLVKQKMMAIPLSACNFGVLVANSAKKAVRGEVEMGKIKFLDTIVKLIAEQHPAQYAKTICSQLSSSNGFLARSALLPDPSAFLVCLEPVSSLPRKSRRIPWSLQAHALIQNYTNTDCCLVPFLHSDPNPTPVFQTALSRSQWRN
jgi:hypothetical protein